MSFIACLGYVLLVSYVRTKQKRGEGKQQHVSSHAGTNTPAETKEALSSTGALLCFCLFIYFTT